MTFQLATATPEAADLLAQRRRERTQALRACRPMERVFLRQLPKSRYSPYVAAKVLGYSDSTVWKFMQRARVKRAMDLFLRDALEEIGVSHTSLVADLMTIKNRCMQVEAVCDKEGKQTGVYEFDASGATSAIKLLVDLLKLAPPKRVELTGADGGPIETLTTHITEDMDAEEAARVYQDIIRTH